MKMNEELISKTVDDVVSTVKFLCEKDLSHLELSSKVDSLNEKMEILQTLVIYSDDKKFVNTICAMQLITNNFNDEIMSELGTTFSDDFKERQLNFLRNISRSFDITLNDINNASSIPNTKSNIKTEYETKVYETKKEYKSKSSTETLDEIIQASNEKIDSYFESSEDLKEYLSFMSNFYNYSIGNTCLIQKQFKGATAVGSFKFWKDNGFSVNKGEKGIQILTPTHIKTFIDENGDTKYLYSATKEQKLNLKKGILKESESKMSYKKGYVFDISQTNASIDDLPKLFPNKWLDGEVKNYDVMYESMVDVANHIGVNIIAPKDELGVVKGVSYTLTKEVALNPRNSQLQNVKTLLHELSHAKLHTISTRDNYTKSEREFQAEMVAYSICSYFGLDTSDYSLSYLHHYTKGTDIKEKKKLLNEIKSTSKEFIEIMEDSISNKKNIIKISNDDSIDIEYETSEEIAQAIADVIDAPIFEENNIYVKFLWSENSNIDDNSIFKFDIANELLETLTELHYTNKNTGYDKTKFELYFDRQCTDRFYSGRFDIGDGYAKNLKEHIYKFTNQHGDILGISENTKKSLFKELNITSNLNTLNKSDHLI